jgi:cytochrome bd-type quinol oxidase subunit 1
MRTADSVTPAGGVFGLFVGFSLLYTILTVTVVVLLFRIAAGKSAEAY